DARGGLAECGGADRPGDLVEDRGKARKLRELRGGARGGTGDEHGGGKVTCFDRAEKRRIEQRDVGRGRWRLAQLALRGRGDGGARLGRGTPSFGHVGARGGGTSGGEQDGDDAAPDARQGSSQLLDDAQGTSERSSSQPRL